MSMAIIVHGGAGSIQEARIPAARLGAEQAAKAGWNILVNGGTAVDAAVAAAVALEDNAQFNAGYGAVLTEDGKAELDAGLMDGETLNVGAVAGVRRVKNPILAAKAMLAVPQTLIIGSGAEDFAQQRGLTMCEPEAMIEPCVYRRWQELKQKNSEPTRITDPDEKHGTIGAVAVDASNHIASAASTGGVMMKVPGRVGDTPLAGAGFYAEDGSGAAACTGQGEYFIRLVIARRAVEFMSHGYTAQEAADACVKLLTERLGGDGGLITVDAAGTVGFARNTQSMIYAYCLTSQTDPVSGW